MKGWFLTLLAAGCATALPPPSLTQTIDRVIATPELQRAVWAIDVEDEAGSVIYQHNGSTLVMPASNRKIFAASSALNCLGPDHRFPTELWLDGNNLVLRGGGDPALGGRWAFDRGAVFAPFVNALRERGIVAVDDIIADVSLFDRVTIPGSWKSGNLGSDYAAPVDALAYNENVAGITVEDCARPLVTTDPAFVVAVTSVTCGVGEPKITVDPLNVVNISGPIVQHFEALPSVATPSLYAVQALSDALKHGGITVRGQLRVNTLPQPWGERIAVIDSQPLWQLLTVMLKNSQNLYAEMLFKSTAGTYSGAEDLERDFLTREVGIDPAEFRFVDGSGLAPDDLVTPAAMVKLFRWMNAPVRRGFFWTILATPGEEGTLRRRLVPLAGRLRGKTGTIAGVNALSGIVAGTHGGYRYFSVVINHHIADSSAASHAIDEIVVAIADF